jgi:hypothetical protein
MHNFALKSFKKHLKTRQSKLPFLNSFLIKLSNKMIQFLKTSFISCLILVAILSVMIAKSVTSTQYLYV